MRASDFDMEYYNASDDKGRIEEPYDTRKPRMTLKTLNKLKKMRAAQDLENHIRMDTLEIIYGSSGEEAQAGGL